ncbi:hypothetical protein ACFYR1_50850 [Streptomyces canus]|uniref:hypothetical protein n=1 Tax=Streptomyces canus TaxID=58343 RepID=UPI0036C62051
MTTLNLFNFAFQAVFFLYATTELGLSPGLHAGRPRVASIAIGVPNPRRVWHRRVISAVDRRARERRRPPPLTAAEAELQ